MRKPKIIFFDIDGTLIDMEKKQVTPLMLSALHKLQANGIRLAIAIGRSPMALPLEEFPGVQFDVLVTFNGSYCYDKDRVLSASPIPSEDIRTLRKMPPHWAAPCVWLLKAALPPTARTKILQTTLPLQRKSSPLLTTLRKWQRAPCIKL